MSFVVSLTSHPNRLRYLDSVVEELVRQTVLPSTVVINLPSECFWLPNPDIEFPFKIDIHYVEDVGPATKLIPTLASHPEDAIVTIDDDVEYDPSLFERILEAHNRFPELRVAGHVRLVPVSPRLPYVLWPKVISRRDQIVTGAVPLGCEGVLYPPHFFRSDVGDLDALLSIAATNDDLWFWAHGQMSEPAVVALRFRIDSRRREGSNDSGLWRRNRSENSRVYRKMLAKYSQLESARPAIRPFAFHFFQFVVFCLFKYLRRK